jgi:hypothetical protein
MGERLTPVAAGAGLGTDGDGERGQFCAGCFDVGSVFGRRGRSKGGCCREELQKDERRNEHCAKGMLWDKCEMK